MKQQYEVTFLEAEREGRQFVDVAAQSEEDALNVAMGFLGNVTILSAKPFELK